MTSRTVKWGGLRAPRNFDYLWSVIPPRRQLREKITRLSCAQVSRDYQNRGICDDSIWRLRVGNSMILINQSPTAWELATLTWPIKVRPEVHRHLFLNVVARTRVAHISNAVRPALRKFEVDCCLVLLASSKTLEDISGTWCCHLVRNGASEL